MGNIDWVEIEHLPDELKDGRPLLVAEHAGSLGWLLSVARYEGGHWWNGISHVQASHWAELHPPGEQDPGIPMYKMSTDD